MILLSLEAVTVALGGREVVKNASLEVRAGELVGLIGPNGAGKTTLLRAAMGLLPSEGRVELFGAALDSLSARERALRCSYLPQGRNVEWPVSVETVVALGRTPHRSMATRFSEEDRERVEHAMRCLDLVALRERPATELSGGECARVLIARALAQDSPLLLADEPTAGLDASHQISLMDTFRELVGGSSNDRSSSDGDSSDRDSNRRGRAIVVSLHDLGLAARWCDRLVMMQSGAIVADGEPAEVLTKERLRDVYGIEAHIGRDADGPLVVPIALARNGEKR